MIIFINPPYAEAGNRKELGNNKNNVSNESKIHKKYIAYLGKSIREIFIQFFIRIYKEIPSCMLASFSTLKYINSQNLKNFRTVFKAKFKKGFIIPANTFDNVNGKFPIGFLIWDLSKREKQFKQVKLDVFDNKQLYLGKKNFIVPKKETINQWFKSYVDNNSSNDFSVGFMCCIGTDFQHNNFCNIDFEHCLKGVGNAKGISKAMITKSNLIQSSIYFAVRQCINATWLNQNDQFLYPKKGWQNDYNFQSDCLIFTLFHTRNRISSENGKNNFIPFNYDEMNCKNAPDSDFMVKYLKDFQNGKYQITTETILEKNSKNLVEKNNLQITFSDEANNVLSAAQNLFKYFHEQTNSEFPNASLYDIKKHFQGISEKTGKVNSKSDNVKYNALLQTLKDALQNLAQNIKIKVYEYEFLLN